MSLISWRYYKIHCLLLWDQRRSFLAGTISLWQEPRQPQLPPSPAGVPGAMDRLSQQEGLYALSSCSYLQHTSVHSTVADIQPNVQSYVYDPGPLLGSERERKTLRGDNLPQPQPDVLDR